MKGQKANFEFKAGIILALLITGITLIGFFYLPYDYNAMDSERRFTPPGIKHLMGTDNFGRDVFSSCNLPGKVSIYVNSLSSKIYTSTLNDGLK